MDRGLLRQLLRTHFNEAELQDICFDLRVDYEELPGHNKLEKIRELIGFCEREGRLPDLLALCQQVRPRLSWQDVTRTSANITEHENLEQAIAALEAQRVTLGDAVVDVALGPLRQQLEALTSPKLPPQHKQVTVLYARQSGFTMMYRIADLEILKDIMYQAWERLDTAVVQHGGRINSRSGEQMIALFGADTASPDDPVRAVKAALAMQSSLGEMKGEHNLPLSIRIGISTGSVLLEQAGNGREFTLFGDTLKVADALESQAPIDGVLISDVTYDQVRGIFKVDPFDPVPMSGREDPIKCYLVRGVKEVAFNSERHGIAGVTTRMVGRDFEMSELSEAYLAAAEDGERQMVTVTGETGLGKTRLLDEFLDWLELRPERIRLYKSDALPENQGTPYSLVRSLLAQRLPGLESAGIDEMHEALETHLAETLFSDPAAEMKAHFIGHLLGFDFSHSPHVQAVADDAQQLLGRATLYLIEYFTAVSSLRRVVIFLDNLHWADDSSLDLLNRLTLALNGRRVLLVSGAQPSFWERRPHWGEGYEWHTRLDLRPLSRRQSRQLLGEILQKMENAPESLQQKILDSAVGNPLYLVEIVKMLLRDGTIAEEGDKWVLHADWLERLRVPSTLVGILQASLDALSPPERNVLRRAAVIGSTFWNRTVAYLASEVSEEQLEVTNRVLAQLHSREVISRREISRFAATDEYAFRNGMLRQVSQESVPQRVRQVFDGLAAKWLLEHSGERADENAGEIADHLQRSGQKEEAVVWLQKAGDQAAARFAHAEAIAYYGRALALTPKELATERLNLLLKREVGCRFRGERALQAEDIAEMEKLAAGIGDELLLAQVMLRRARYKQEIGDYSDALNASEESLAVATRAGNAELVAQAYMESGRTLWRQGKLGRARECVEQALTQARTAVQPQLEARALIMLGGIITQSNGGYSLAKTFMEEGLTVARKAGDRRLESKAINALGEIAKIHGNYSGARVYYEQSLALARQVGDRWGEELALGNLGDVAQRDGDFAAAQEYCQKAFIIQQEIEDEDGKGYSLTCLGDVLLGLDQLDAAATAFTDASRLRLQLGQHNLLMESRAGLVCVLMARGELAQAVEQANEIIDWVKEHGTDGMEYPTQVLWRCYEALCESKSENSTQTAVAASLLAQLHATITAQAESIDDPSQRQYFLEHIAINREIMAAWEGHSRS